MPNLDNKVRFLFDLFVLEQDKHVFCRENILHKSLCIMSHYDMSFNDFVGVQGFFLGLYMFSSSSDNEYLFKVKETHRLEVRVLLAIFVLNIRLNSLDESFI